MADGPDGVFKSTLRGATILASGAQRDEEHSVLSDRRRIILIVGISIAALFFLFDDVFGLITGGGIFASISAIRAATSKAPSIDVDGAGFRTLFIFAVCLPATVIMLLFKANLSHRAAQFAAMAFIVAAGFMLDGAYDEKIVGHTMASYGYSRCETRDRVEGNGKSRVWYDNYVLRPADCPAKRQRS